jgi:hypothetical protein
MSTPTQIESHSHRFKNDAWRGYSMRELGDAAAFFVKRSTHRDPESQQKRIEKDLVDATNYTSMFLEHINEAREAAGLPAVKIVEE